LQLHRGPGHLRVMKAWFVLGLFLVAQAARAAQPAAEFDTSGRYQQCAAMTKTDAQGAYNQALAWHSAGGGASAEHCGALALVQLGRYSEAAPQLDRLAQRLDLKAALRAQLYDQEGNAWLLAQDAERAAAAFTNALALVPQDVDTLADRARARAMRKDWTGAERDLSSALGLDGNRADLLVLRASARHAGGKLAEARADIERALQVYPDYGDALVERGAMRFEDGDVKGADADWRMVVKLAPRSRAAALANEYLSQTGAQ